MSECPDGTEVKSPTPPKQHIDSSMPDKDAFMASVASMFPYHSTLKKCRYCDRPEGASLQLREGATPNIKLLTCSLCENTRYCSVECQKADWKRHKTSDECTRFRDNVNNRDVRAVADPIRANFSSAAAQWMTMWEGEAGYAAGCALRPGLKGDRSKTHTLVVEWIFQPKETRRRFQFVLDTAEVVAHKQAAVLYERYVGGDPNYEWGLTPEGVIARGNFVPRANACPVNILSFFKYRVGSVQHMFHALAVKSHSLDTVNLIDDDWLDVLRKSLTDAEIPSPITMLFAQYARRPDGGTAEAVEQGFATPDGGVPKSRKHVSEAEKQRRKNKKKNKKAGAGLEAEMAGLAVSEGADAPDVEDS